MSAAARQQSCAACGRPFAPDDVTNVEPLVVTGDQVRYVATHEGESTFHHARFLVREAAHDGQRFTVIDTSTSETVGRFWTRGGADGYAHLLEGDYRRGTRS
jgi:hypothetical protein